MISFWLTNVPERREESLKPLRLEMVGGSDPKALQVVDGLSLDLAISPFVLASDAIVRYYDGCQWPIGHPPNQAIQLLELFPGNILSI